MGPLKGIALAKRIAAARTLAERSELEGQLRQHYSSTTAKRLIKKDLDGDDDAPDEGEPTRDLKKAKKAARPVARIPTSAAEARREIANLDASIRRLEKKAGLPYAFAPADIADYRKAHPFASVAEACLALSVAARGSK
jgi:hypothetical protein